MLLVGAIGVVLFVGLCIWYEFEAHPLGGQGAKVVVTIANDESTTSAINTLTNDGVIDSAFAFRLSDIVHGTPVVDPGSYLFHQNESFGDVRAILSGGPNVTAITVLPGYSLHEMAGKLDGVQTDLGTKWAPRFVRLSRGLPITATNKVLKRALRAERWNCAEPVLWQSDKRGPYQLLTPEEATTLEAAVSHRVI